MECPAGHARPGIFLPERSIRQRTEPQPGSFDRTTVIE